LEQALLTGNPAVLDPLLDDWVEARTQSEIEADSNSLPPLLNRMLAACYEIAAEVLPAVEALSLLGAILPVYTHTFEYTARKETELHVQHVSQELETAHLRLERLDRSKSNFIAIAAHELKTPLTLIEGYTAMLRETLVATLPADPERHLAALLHGMDQGTRRLRTIIDDMIDVSIIDNNLLSLSFQPVWLKHILRQVCGELAAAVVERKQCLKLEDFPGNDAMTFGDEERLQQAFYNVVVNAIKFTPDGGHIQIDGRLLSGFVEVRIIDSGIGIDPQDQGQIFEKFGQLGQAALHSSSKTRFKGGGPGLGLPITKGIIEAHGGTIWVESAGHDEINCPGSTFHILLPLRDKPPDDKTAKLFQAFLFNTQPGEFTE
jgi:signal transduction histidine kinase